MEFGQVAITDGVGVFGVVLGTIARPYFEEWFVRRKKTLHVVVFEPSEFRAPHASVVLSWHGESTHRIVQTGFKLENRTGRTLRNFRLEIGAKTFARDDQPHSVYLEESDKARFAVDKNDVTSRNLFELMEPNARNGWSVVIGALSALVVGSFASAAAAAALVGLLGSR